MNTHYVVVAFVLGAGFGSAPAADTRERMSLRVDVQVYDARVIAAAVDFETLFRRLPAPEQRGTLIYLEASFKAPETNKKATGQRKARDILGADRLAIEVEFPHKNAKEKPVRVKGHLHPDACCGKSMEALLRIPDQARMGDVQITIVWGDAKELKGGSATLEVSIKPAK